MLSTSLYLDVRKIVSSFVCFHHCCIHVVVSIMSSTKQKNNNGVETLALDVKSDDETIIYGEHDSSDESINLSSDEISSDSDESDSDSEVLADVCVWCRVDLQHLVTAAVALEFS